MATEESQPVSLPKGRLAENIIWLTSLQALNYLLPMATVPYLIRVLGATNYGVMAFAVTFTQYLVLLTDYGFNLSATRQVALVRNDRNKLEESVSAVLVIKAALLIVSVLIMAVVLAVPSRYSQYGTVMAIAFLSVVGTVLFPTWLFQGLQDMRVVTLLSTVGRLVCTSAIFLTVRSRQDVALATLWTVSAIPISGVTAWFVIRRRYKLALGLPSRQALQTALASGFHVFLSSAMGGVLINGAVLVLSLMTPMHVVGVYAAIERIAKAAVMMFAPLTQALYPRTVEHFHTSYAEGKRFVMRTGAMVVGLAAAVSLILVALARPVILLICGSAFVPYAPVLRVLAVWLFIGVLNNILGIQYLLASGRYRVYSTCFTAAALTTFVLLFVLVRKYSYMGAAVSVTVGEILLTLLMIIVALKSQESPEEFELSREGAV